MTNRQQYVIFVYRTAQIPQPVNLSPFRFHPPPQETKGAFFVQKNMAIKTYTEQLEEVQDAIEKVLTGQSYSIAGRALTRPDLDTLYAQEARLRPLADAESAGRTGARVRYVEPNS